MPQYNVRLVADSIIRMSRKPYSDASDNRSFAFSFPEPTVCVFDRFVAVAEGLSVPHGLIIQVGLRANDIDQAIDLATQAAGYVLSVISVVGAASVFQPKVVWAYDSTPDVQDRDYRHFSYDTSAELMSRPLDAIGLRHLLDKLFEGFLAAPETQADWKDRVQRSITAFRRALADNHDVLTEYLICWSSMEALDCVYRKVRPSATTRNSMDGVRDILERLGNAAQFDTLKNLRNGLAHGSITVTQATQTAAANRDLVRKAVVAMILRIVKADQSICDALLAREVIKGRGSHYFKFLGTIRLQPGDIKHLGGHPEVAVSCKSIAFEKEEDKMILRPCWSIAKGNAENLDILRYELHGEKGFSLTIEPGKITPDGGDAEVG